MERPTAIEPNTEVLVTVGAYEALFTAIMGHINPGDEVIIIEPYFDCYEPMVRLAGGIPKFIALAPVRRIDYFLPVGGSCALFQIRGIQYILRIVNRENILEAEKSKGVHV